MERGEFPDAFSEVSLAHDVVAVEHAAREVAQVGSAHVRQPEIVQLTFSGNVPDVVLA